jgi:hypothetical protein
VPTKFRDKHGIPYTVRDKANGDPIELPVDNKGNIIKTGTMAAAITRDREWIETRQKDGVVRMRPTRLGAGYHSRFQQHISRHIYTERITELLKVGLNVSAACHLIAKDEISEWPRSTRTVQAVKDRANQIRNIYYNALRPRPP